MLFIQILVNKCWYPNSYFNHNRLIYKQYIKVPRFINRYIFLNKWYISQIFKIFPFCFFIKYKHLIFNFIQHIYFLFILPLYTNRIVNYKNYYNLFNLKNNYYISDNKVEKLYYLVLKKIFFEINNTNKILKLFFFNLILKRNTVFLQGVLSNQKVQFTTTSTQFGFKKYKRYSRFICDFFLLLSFSYMLDHNITKVGFRIKVMDYYYYSHIFKRYFEVLKSLNFNFFCRYYSRFFKFWKFPICRFIKKNREALFITKNEKNKYTVIIKNYFCCSLAFFNLFVVNCVYACIIFLYLRAITRKRRFYRHRYRKRKKRLQVYRHSFRMFYKVFNVDNLLSILCYFYEYSCIVIPMFVRVFRNFKMYSYFVGLLVSLYKYFKKSHLRRYRNHKKIFLEWKYLVNKHLSRFLRIRYHKIIFLNFFLFFFRLKFLCTILLYHKLILFLFKFVFKIFIFILKKYYKYYNLIVINYAKEWLYHIYVNLYFKKFEAEKKIGDELSSNVSDFIVHSAESSFPKPTKYQQPKDYYSLCRKVVKETRFRYNAFRTFGIRLRKIIYKNNFCKYIRKVRHSYYSNFWSKLFYLRCSFEKFVENDDELQGIYILFKKPTPFGGGCRLPKARRRKIRKSHKFLIRPNTLII